MIGFFEKFSDIIATFSDSTDGNLSFKWSGDNVLANRQTFFNQLELSLPNLVTVQQVHGNKIIKVISKDRGRGSTEKNWLNGYDALITNEKNIILGIETADCLPVFFYDKQNQVIAIAHAGWQGVVKEIIPKLAELMKKDYNTKSDSLHIAIGPHIGKCCFEIKQDILDMFPSKFLQKINNRLYYDLTALVVDQLKTVGVHHKNLEISSVCTSCNHKYYSYRRDKSANQGGQLGIITLI